jgi:hypothetical protein
MADHWDKFPSNIGETLGLIERNSFNFKHSRFEVWQGGPCRYSGNSNGLIIAKVNNEHLNVTIDDVMINNNIKT